MPVSLKVNTVIPVAWVGALFGKVIHQMILINSAHVYFVMVRIDEILGLALVIAASSSLIGSKKGYSYQKQSIPITSKQFYKPQLDFNLKAISTINDARTKLLSIRGRDQEIRSKIIQQEKQRTQYQVDYLQTQKKQAGALLSQLQKIESLGAMYESYSPRMAANIVNKTGISPIDQTAIARGKQANIVIPKIDELIRSLDLGILSARKSFESLESL